MTLFQRSGFLLEFHDVFNSSVLLTRKIIHYFGRVWKYLRCPYIIHPNKVVVNLFMSILERTSLSPALPYIEAGSQAVNPTVAIVIPAYNEGGLIERTLRSIDSSLKIVDQPVRVVVVNNASTDHTGEIARASGAMVVEEARKGIARARQTGVESLPDSVEIVLSTDADSIVPKEWIHAYLHVLSNPSIIAAYGPIKYIFDAKPSVMEKVSSIMVGFLSELYRTVNRTNRIIKGSGANSAIKISAIQSVGGYDDLLLRGEDTELFHRLSGLGPIVPIDEVVLTSNRRIRNRGFLNHALRRLRANLYYFKSGLYPQESQDSHVDIR